MSARAMVKAGSFLQTTRKITLSFLNASDRAQLNLIARKLLLEMGKITRKFRKITNNQSQHPLKRHTPQLIVPLDTSICGCIRKNHSSLSRFSHDAQTRRDL